ncbi:nascent polypeptide-associated complex protein [Candidatus Woesearchaeota archaeon]|nr:nascent polypeptide-associated complex protein [Candidatus Woesearchaeota archaeon]
MRMDDRAIRAAMQKMGMQSQEIAAREVIIRAEGKDIIITNPHVTKVNMMGQQTFQIMGTVNEKAAATGTGGAGISKEDIETVMQQAGVDMPTAEKALNESKGDLAEAILALTGAR